MMPTVVASMGGHLVDAVVVAVECGAQFGTAHRGGRIDADIPVAGEQVGEQHVLAGEVREAFAQDEHVRQ